MDKCNLIYSAYLDEDILNNYNKNLKDKVIYFLNEIFVFLKENADFDEYEIPYDMIIDVDFLQLSINLLNCYEKKVLNNKFSYYERDEFWGQQILLMMIMYKYNFDSIEQYVICTLDKIIKNMLQNNSIAIIYPNYFKNGKLKNEYKKLSMEELEIKYRNEFGIRYDDKLID